MFERTVALADPVTIYLDDAPLTAERGEPLAVSLLAAGEVRVARSPKLHRPRGPACLRGDCDGCLARVDGVPNVMTCLRDARGDERIETQNVLGTRKLDLLRVTDWFFPRGIDHHHLMAGIPAVGDLMQTFARQMAGIGRLPDRVAPEVQAHRQACDVLVVGGGLAGAHASAALAQRGLSVHLVDDAAEPGGSAIAAGDRARVLLDEATPALSKVTMHARASAVGSFGEEVLVAMGPRKGVQAAAWVFSPRALVIATGAHDGAICVPGNDLPGVMSARAVAGLASTGILPKHGAVIVGDGPWAKRVRDLLGDRVRASVLENEIETIRGSASVKAVQLKDGRTIRTGCIAVDAVGAPAFELAAQAGAAVRWTGHGYAIETDEGGRARGSEDRAMRVWAVGECTGMPFEPAAIAAAAKRVSADIAAELGQPR